MTPSEELFKNFFSDEKKLVSSMDDLELRAHREELSKIAFEARARLTATDDEQRERNAESKKKKGFQTSIEIDDFATDAINTIKQRQAKMSKTDKLIENLMKLPGIDRATAEKMVSATTQLEIKNSKGSTIADNLNKKNLESAVNEIIKPAETIKIINPFAKQTEPILQKTETVTKADDKTAEEPKTIINPFAK